MLKIISKLFVCTMDNNLDGWINRIWVCLLKLNPKATKIPYTTTILVDIKLTPLRWEGLVNFCKGTVTWPLFKPATIPVRDSMNYDEAPVIDFYFNSCFLPTNIDEIINFLKFEFMNRLSNWLVDGLLMYLQYFIIKGIYFMA